MKKKILISIFLLPFLTLNMVSAVGLSDIPLIKQIARQMVENAVAFYQFANGLDALDDKNFVVTIIDSTQTFTLTNAQKNGMLAKYQDHKKILKDTWDSLP